MISLAKLLKEENKKIKSPNLALLLVHDLLLAKGIQAGDGPIKQAILRHRTRLNAELQKIKIKRGVKDVKDLAISGDPRAGPSYLLELSSVATEQPPVDRTDTSLRTGEHSPME